MVEAQPTEETIDDANRYKEFFNEYYKDELEELESPSLSVNAENSGRLYQPSLTIDLEHLKEFDEELYQQTVNNTEEYWEDVRRGVMKSEHVDDDIERVHIRTKGPCYDVQIRDIRAPHTEKIVKTEGRVEDSTTVNPTIVNAHYRCTQCGHTEFIPQDVKGWNEPNDNDFCDCDRPRYDMSFTKSEKVNIQRISLKETQEGLRGGEAPKTKTAYLRGDITGDVSAGDEIDLFGIVKPDRQENSAVFETYLEGKYLEQKERSFEDIEVTEEEAEKFEEMAEGDIMQDFVDSYAPKIFGWDNIKKPLILALVSGVRKEDVGMNRRGDIHVLLVGDPGVGKSKLLSFAEVISPIGISTTGKGSSSAGLTATAERTSGIGNNEESWTLKAGALVLADKGIAVVDELDKMDEDDRSSMHEALEEQTVSISKAGVNAEFSTRCAMISAANPEKGTFQEHQPITQQVDLEPPLISRFDVIFKMVDRPDEDIDRYVANEMADANDDSVEQEIPLDTDEMTKYIAYARNNYAPSQTEASKQAIIDEYVDLRSRGDTDMISVTLRKLEGMFRLSEAHARINLEEEVTEENAQEAIEIINETLEETHMTPDGEMDATRVSQTVSASEEDVMNKIADAVGSLSEEGDTEGAERSEVIEMVAEQFSNYQKEDVGDVLDQMLMLGEDIYNSSNGLKLDSSAKQS